MAKTVNLGDKYNHRVTLRLNDEQFNYVCECSKMLDVSPSEFLRMSINAGMYAVPLSEKGQVGTHENVKADSHNLV